jgi:predicted 3-demethylubiquinone-9 3-methyltransferase (glyoxalase superfamily)
VECGWLKDKFGVSWQIIPSGLGDLLQYDDPDKARKAMEAMLMTDKIDINVMREAGR